MAITHGCLLIGRAFRFQMGFQGFDHFLHFASPQSLLLGSPPGLGFIAAAYQCRCTHVLADVEKIAQEYSLLAKDFPAQKPNPLSPVTSGVDPTVQSPACLSCAMSPTSSGFLYASKCGAVNRRRTVLGLGRYQSHLFPFAGTFAPTRSRCHGADHRSVSLSDHMLGTHRRQNSKGLLICLTQRFTCPVGMFHRRCPYGTGSNLKPIMFPNTLSRPGKSLLTPKVGQDTLQSSGATSGRDSQPRGQGAQVFLGWTAPDSFAYLDQSEHTPPLQCFFLRLSTVGSWLLSSVLTRSSTCAAH